MRWTREGGEGDQSQHLGAKQSKKADRKVRPPNQPRSPADLGQQRGTSSTNGVEMAEEEEELEGAVLFY
jgi:hypothetical protein